MASPSSVLHWNPVLRVRAMTELDDRRHRESTYTTPLHRTNDMKDFLQDFYRNVYTPQKKEFYQQERQRYPILDIFYQQLCGSQVSFEDFWQRYEYRCCHLERVAEEIAEQDAETRKKVASSIQGVWNAVVRSPKSPERIQNPALGDRKSLDTPLNVDPKDTAQRALDDAVKSFQDVWAVMTNAANTSTPQKDSSSEPVALEKEGKEEQLLKSEVARLRALELARMQVEEERKLKAKLRLEQAEMLAKAEEEAQRLREEEEARLEPQESFDSTGSSIKDEEAYSEVDSSESSSPDEDTAVPRESTGSGKAKKWKKRLAQKRDQRRGSAMGEINASIPPATGAVEASDEIVVVESSTSSDAQISENPSADTATKAKGRKSEKWKQRIASKRADRNSNAAEPKEDTSADLSSHAVPPATDVQEPSQAISKTSHANVGESSVEVSIATREVPDVPMGTPEQTLQDSSIQESSPMRREEEELATAPSVEDISLIETERMIELSSADILEDATADATSLRSPQLGDVVGDSLGTAPTSIQDCSLTTSKEVEEKILVEGPILDSAVLISQPPISSEDVRNPQVPEFDVAGKSAAHHEQDSNLDTSTLEPTTRSIIAPQQEDTTDVEEGGLYSLTLSPQIKPIREKLDMESENDAALEVVKESRDEKINMAKIDDTRSSHQKIALAEPDRDSPYFDDNDAKNVKCDFCTACTIM